MFKALICFCAMSATLAAQPFPEYAQFCSHDPDLIHGDIQRIDETSFLLVNPGFYMFTFQGFETPLYVAFNDKYVESSLVQLSTIETPIKEPTVLTVPYSETPTSVIIKRF